MDMWRPFRSSTSWNAPQAAVLFDKFHVMRHLGEALDKVRKAEYALPSHPQNLWGPARKNLKLLLAANKRLHTAYLRKESFGERLF
jgi:transposase